MNTDAWETYHRRAAALRGVVEQLDRTTDTEPAWDDELAAVFGSRDELLRALHDQWTRRLEARVEMALELGEDLPAECIENAWFEVAAELPGVRRVLDAHADDEALRRHRLHELRLLAIAAGMVSSADPLERAAAAGRGLVQRIRAQHVEPAVPRPRLGDRIASMIRWQNSSEAARERAAQR